MLGQGKVTFGREQTSELTPYEDCSVDIPDNGMSFTMRDLFEKVCNRYDLKDGMIFLANGREIDMDTILEDGQHVFAKEGLKSRAV